MYSLYIHSSILFITSIAMWILDYLQLIIKTIWVENEEIYTIVYIHSTRRDTPEPSNEESKPIPSWAASPDGDSNEGLGPSEGISNSTRKEVIEKQKELTDALDQQEKDLEERNKLNEEQTKAGDNSDNDEEELSDKLEELDEKISIRAKVLEVILEWFGK